LNSGVPVKPMKAAFGKAMRLMRNHVRSTRLRFRAPMAPLLVGPPSDEFAFPPLLESSELVTTLLLDGRGVYHSADDGYGRNGKTATPLRTLTRNLSA
jgi:hypothetical protein